MRGTKVKLSSQLKFKTWTIIFPVSYALWRVVYAVKQDTLLFQNAMKIWEWICFIYSVLNFLPEIKQERPN